MRKLSLLLLTCLVCAPMVAAETAKCDGLQERRAVAGEINKSHPGAALYLYADILRKTPNSDCSDSVKATLIQIATSASTIIRRSPPPSTTNIRDGGGVVGGIGVSRPIGEILAELNQAIIAGGNSVSENAPLMETLKGLFAQLPEASQQELFSAYSPSDLILDNRSLQAFQQIDKITDAQLRDLESSVSSGIE